MAVVAIEHIDTIRLPLFYCLLVGLILMVFGLMLLKYIKYQNKPQEAILFLRGSFNPIHNNHISVLMTIKQELESNHNIRIIKGCLIPNTDETVIRKLGSEAMRFKHRRNLCEIAVNTNPAYSSWIEVAQCTYFVREYVSKLIASNKRYESMLMINCIGGDKIVEYNAKNKWSKYKQKLQPYTDRITTVVLKRNAYVFDVDAIKHTAFNEDISIKCIDINDEDTISSTKIRSLISNYKNEPRKCYHQLKEMMNEQCIDYILDRIDQIWLN